jgi:hypothetical protein
VRDQEGGKTNKDLHPHRQFEELDTGTISYAGTHISGELAHLLDKGRKAWPF